MTQLIEKNFDIAKKTYGLESIHLLKHLFVYFMCNMAICDIDELHEAQRVIKMMESIITRFHGKKDGDFSN